MPLLLLSHSMFSCLLMSVSLIMITSSLICLSWSLPLLREWNAALNQHISQVLHHAPFLLRMIFFCFALFIQQVHKFDWNEANMYSSSFVWRIKIYLPNCLKTILYNVFFLLLQKTESERLFIPKGVGGGCRLLKNGTVWDSVLPLWQKSATTSPSPRA
jgi:hypothetical protein